MGPGRPAVQNSRYAGRRRYREVPAHSAPEALVAESVREQRGDDAVVGNAAQRQQNRQLGHRGHGGLEELPAGSDLRCGRPVLGRHAADRVCDRGVDKSEAVIRPGIERAGGEAEFEHRAVEQLAGCIAGKRAASAVCSAQTRGKADDQQFGRFWSECGHRCVEPRRLRGSPDPAKFSQARA